MKYIIIGGIAAGMSTAAKLKRVDKESEVIIYEKSNNISFGACGLPYFVGDFFKNKEEMIARTVEQAEKNGIKVYLNHEVTSCNFVNKKIIVKDVKTLEQKEDHYDKLMIATGAKGFIPNIKNLNIKDVYTLRTMDDGIDLKKALENTSNKSIGIIGAGFIGLEVVEACKKMNKEVHVFQLEDSVLKGVFDKEITDIMEKELIDKGVNLHLSNKVLELRGKSKVEVVITDNGEFNVDVIVLATGVVPCTDFLKDTNISMLQNGAIVINEYGETSIKDVYSAGDCATINHVVLNKPVYIPLATGANKLGRLIGENIVGNKEKFQGTLGASCVKVLDLEAARVGLTEKEAQDNGIEYKTTFIEDMNHTSYYPGQSKIHLKLIYEEKSKLIIGAQGVGAHDVVQRVNILGTAIFNKMTTKELGMLDLCYAPPFSRTWDIINVIGNVSK